MTRDFDLPEDLLAALRNPAVPARQEDGAFGRLVSWVVAPPSNKSVFSPGEVLPADQFLWSGIEEQIVIAGTTAA